MLSDGDKEDIRKMVAAAEDTDSLVSLALDARNQTAFNRELLGQLEHVIQERMGAGVLYEENGASVKRKPREYEWDRERLLDAGLGRFFSPKELKPEWKYETRKLNTRLSELDPGSQEAQSIEAARTVKYKFEYEEFPEFRDVMGER